MGEVKMRKLTIQEEIQIAKGNIKGLRHFEAMTGGSEELEKDLLAWENELGRLEGLLEVKAHQSGFQYDSKEVKFGRERYLLEGEIVGLSCKDCSQAYPLEGFNKSKNGVAEKDNKCKACRKKETDKWQKGNPEKRKAKDKSWNEQNKAYRLAQKHNRRAQKHNNQALLTREMVKQMFDVATRIENGQEVVRCQVTGKPITSRPHLGHVIAVENEGGDSSLQNMVVISPAVNKRQGSMNLFEWLLTKKGQEMASKEHVQWLVEYLAQQNKTNRSSFLRKQLGREGAQKFYEVYYKTPHSEKLFLVVYNALTKTTA
jgi:hypothetical protein